VSDASIVAPCVVFALGREAQPFRRPLGPHVPFPGAPCRAHLCGPAGLTVLVLETGVGAGRTRRALQWLFSGPPLRGRCYHPGPVLVAGFCGALDEQVRVGDLVLATEVVDGAGRAWPTTWEGGLPSEQGDPPLHRGRLLTADRLLADPRDKRALGRRHGALVVDMESAAVAEACANEGAQFGCVRAVSDDAHTALSPRLVALLAAGRVSPLRVAANLARSPRLIPELWRLARHTRLAARHLAAALWQMLGFA
jgi:nucleoside phosphorylase